MGNGCEKTFDVIVEPLERVKMFPVFLKKFVKSFEMLVDGDSMKRCPVYFFAEVI